MRAHAERCYAPGPHGYRLIGSLRQLRASRLQFVTDITREYGDIVAFRAGFRTIYLLNHPHYAKHVLYENQKNYKKGVGLTDAKPLLGEGLLTSEGCLWASQRRQIQRAFSRDKLQEFSTLVTDATGLMFEHWKACSRTSQGLDAIEEMQHLTLRILGSTLFHTNLSDSANEVVTSLAVVTRWATRRITALVKLPLRVPTRQNLRTRKALCVLEEVIERILRESRKDCSEGHDDVLDILLSLDGAKDGRRMRGSQLRDELMTFLLAGHETTAAALAWTWYLLSQHPGVEARLLEELDRVLGGRTPTWSDCPRLIYTKMVIDEVLRLYPPVWMIPRKAIADDRIGGYTIPSKSDVLISVFSMHRHPQCWERPEMFDPERFATERLVQLSPYCYLPFGAGPRSCLGTSIAMMEMILIVAMVAQKYKLQPVAPYTIEAEPLLTLRPLYRVAVSLRRCEEQSSSYGDPGGSG